MEIKKDLQISPDTVPRPYGCLFWIRTAIALRPSGLKQLVLDGVELTATEIAGEHSRYGIEPPGLIVEARLNARGPDEAQASAHARVHFLAASLALSSGTGPLPPQELLIVDRSVGLEGRPFRQYFVGGDAGLPAHIESSDLDRCIRSLLVLSPPKDERIARASRWLWKALIGDDPIDQFVWLWNGLETIASLLAESANLDRRKMVELKCGHCGQSMVCSACGELLQPRDGNASVIENWATRCGHGDKCRDINQVRNGILHGFMRVGGLYGTCGSLIPVLAELLYRAIGQIAGQPPVPAVLRNLAEISPVRPASRGYVEGLVYGWSPEDAWQTYPSLHQRPSVTSLGNEGVQTQITFDGDPEYRFAMFGRGVAGSEARVTFGQVVVTRGEPGANLPEAPYTMERTTGDTLHTK